MSQIGLECPPWPNLTLNSTLILPPPLPEYWDRDHNVQLSLCVFFFFFTINFIVIACGVYVAMYKGQRKTWWGPFSLSIPMCVPGTALTSGLCVEHFLFLEPSLALFLFVYLCVGAHACAHVCVPKCMFACHVHREGRGGRKKAGDRLELVFVSHHMVPGLESSPLPEQKAFHCWAASPGPPAVKHLRWEVDWLPFVRLFGKLRLLLTSAGKACSAGGEWGCRTDLAD